MAEEASQAPASQNTQAPESTDKPSTDENLTKGNGKEPVDRDLSKPLTAEEKRLFKIKTKIDGIEQESQYDEDQAKILIQKGLAADKRFQESAQLRKQNEELLKLLKDPATLIDGLRSLGHDPRALSENYLAQELELAMMSPDKRLIYQLQMEKAQREAQEKERQRLTHESERKQAEEKFTKQYQDEILATLQKSNLPHTPETIARMAKQKEIFLKNQIDISWDEAARLVEESLANEAKKIFPKLPLSKLKSILGDEMMKAILQDSLNQVKDPVQRSQKGNGQTTSFDKVSGKDRKPFVSQTDFEKHMQQFRGQR